MQRESSVSSKRSDKSRSETVSISSFQDGIHHHDHGDFPRSRLPDFDTGSRVGTPASVSDHQYPSADQVISEQFDDKLRRLNLRDGLIAAHHKAPLGQRVPDHENAMTSESPQQAFGFKVMRRNDSSEGLRLNNFPNGQCNSDGTWFWL